MISEITTIVSNKDHYQKTGFHIVHIVSSLVVVVFCCCPFHLPIPGVLVFDDKDIHLQATYIWVKVGLIQGKTPIPRPQVRVAS